MTRDTTTRHGGDLVAAVLKQHGVRFLFTLCGGHISPILIGAERAGLRVIDTRHEATAVFAADAVARLTGVPGVAAVTAGPGLTNTITAVKNAQMAQSPVLILGGATATLLKGRGSLQDIDQMALMKPHVKWSATVRRVRDIAPTLTRALAAAQSGVPGPVFVELPVDLLYPQATVREWHAAVAGRGRSLGARATRLYLNRHVSRLFRRAFAGGVPPPAPVDVALPAPAEVQKAVATLRAAQRPVLVVGSQALLDAAEAEALQAAVRRLGIPTYLSGMARGLLGHDPLHARHKRRQALKEADVVILAGVPCDFRLNYGRQIGRKTTLIAANRSRDDLTRNRKPDQALHADPGAFVRQLAAAWDGPPAAWAAWREKLAARDGARDAEIAADAARGGYSADAPVNPLALCRALEARAARDSIFIGDGGDFVATASYIVRPRAPLSWLDPGAFGTLGAGAGFALAAKLVRPQAEVWLLYGDGSAGYSLAEFDTFARHGVPVIAVVGNDASWAQIAREQVAIFGTALGTELARTAYHTVADGYGGTGLLLHSAEALSDTLAQAQALAASGRPVLVNAWLAATDFRDGSISM